MFRRERHQQSCSQQKRPENPRGAAVYATREPTARARASLVPRPRDPEASMSAVTAMETHTFAQGETISAPPLDKHRCLSPATRKRRNYEKHTKRFGMESQVLIMWKKEKKKKISQSLYCTLEQLIAGNLPPSALPNVEGRSLEKFLLCIHKGVSLKSEKKCFLSVPSNTNIM